MNRLSIFYQGNERPLIQDRLEKLFIFQGKLATEKILNAFINEFEERGFNVRAVIAGIDSLKDEDLKTVKLNILIEAIRKKQAPLTELSSCGDCDSTGYVIMKDEENRMYSLACRCERGEPKRRAQGLKLWNGEIVQQGNYGVLTKCFQDNVEPDQTRQWWDK